MNHSTWNTAIDEIAISLADDHSQTPMPVPQPTQSLVEPSQPVTGSRSRRRMIDFWNVLGVSVLALSLWMAWQPAAETSISPAATAEPSVSGAAESSFVPAQKPIIEISVGHAVRTDEARGEHDDAFGSQVDAATWKHLVLKCRKVDGSTADVELLRPASWLTDQQAEVGGTIEVSVPECGIEGQASVLAINDCPKLQPTPAGYRTVTGTFRHASADILDITVEGQSEPIGTTAVHPFWSEDRQAYVRADELKVGESLLGDTGRVEITSISTRGSPEPVYNLEVLGDHNYKVTTASLLVHNNCQNIKTQNGRWYALINSRWRRIRPAKRPDVQVHHKIPWNNKTFNHQNHRLVRQANVALKKSTQNQMELGNHAGRHSPSYHREVQRRMTAAHRKVAGKGQDAARKSLNNVMNRIEQDIASGILKPYDTKDVWIP